MENPSWFQSYLAPLGMIGSQAQTQEPGDLKHTQKRGQPRAVLSDITNNAAARGEAGKGPGKQSGKASGHPELSQQNFTNPELIDGVHADKKRRNWVDIDAQNQEDPQACSAYAVSIFQHLRDSELTRRPNARYLEHFQADVNAKMRAILIDWLVEVAEEYKLCADTLYLTVNYIDRFLSVYPVQRSQLQLVGVACMWVAAKYEEIYPPNVGDFCYITDNTYSKEQMVQMEELILKRLGYELTVPTAKTFLRRMLQVCNPDEHLHFLSNYLTEVSLLDHIMMSYLPSEIAASAVFLSNLMLKRPPWDGNLQHYSGYSPRDLVPCLRALADVHSAVSTSTSLAAIREKYGHPRFQSVSRISAIPNLAQQLAAMGWRE